ncbi:transposase [Rhizobium tibeticum]|uniref:transposase n=1 Tax=Rhizobium tibeticum TaxID=501024 RepID=UPI0027D89A9D|nr:transposase [Rhizobium tibeticum]
MVDTGRRRRFSKEVKLRIVAESLLESGLCATTARRHGISRSQLYEWRKLARAGKLRAGSVCLNSSGRYAKWISASMG